MSKTKSLKKQPSPKKQPAELSEAARLNRARELLRDAFVMVEGPLGVNVKVRPTGEPSPKHPTIVRFTSLILEVRQKS